MGRERGNRLRVDELHKQALDSIQAQAEWRSERTWQKECNAWKKKVGDLQRANAQWELESKQRATEWDEQEEKYKVTAALMRQANDVSYLLCLCCIRLLFIL